MSSKTGPGTWNEIIEGEKYILGCLDYIHNNPIKVGIVAEAKDYPWSSYFIYSGLDNKQISERSVIDHYGDTSLVSLSE